MRSQGFTLIELMTVLAILAVLAAIAYPEYARYMVRARRVEAQAAMLELMQKEERYFTRHNAYLAFSAAASDAEARRMRWHSGSRAAGSGYELRGQACDDKPIERCVLIRALPGTDLVDRSFRDPDCGALGLDSKGRRSAAGPMQRCWP